jgi:hypothetical protein
MSEMAKPELSLFHHIEFGVVFESNLSLYPE